MKLFSVYLWSLSAFLEALGNNSWFTRDVTKTKKLSILPRFYFHEVLQHINTFIETNFWFQRVLRFAREDAWSSRLLRDAAFS